MKKSKSVLFAVLASLTVLYSVVQVVMFHWHITDEPQDFTFFGAVVLICCYAAGEAIRLNEPANGNHESELLLVPAVVAYVYMRIASIYLKSHYQLVQYPGLPSGAFESAIEAVVLWAFSICYFWIRHHTRIAHKKRRRPS